MSDDLKERLREVSLEKHKEAWARSDGGQDLTIGAMLADEAADRIEELEAKLAKAMKALEFYGTEANYDGEYFPDPCGCCGSWFEPKIHRDGEDSGDLARTTLAELSSVSCANLKGQNDE